MSLNTLFISNASQPNLVVILKTGNTKTSINTVIIIEALKLNAKEGFNITTKGSQAATSQNLAELKGLQKELKGLQTAKGNQMDYQGNYRDYKGNDRDYKGNSRNYKGKERRVQKETKGARRELRDYTRK